MRHKAIRVFRSLCHDRAVTLLRLARTAGIKEVSSTQSNESAQFFSCLWLRVQHGRLGAALRTPGKAFAACYIYS